MPDALDSFKPLKIFNIFSRDVSENILYFSFNQIFNADVAVDGKPMNFKVFKVL